MGASLGRSLVRTRSLARTRPLPRPQVKQVNRLPIIPLGRLSTKSFNRSNIPEKGIYGWTSNSGKQIKYIGSSNSNISNRLSVHMRNGILTKNNNIYVYPMPISTKTDIYLVEKGLIWSLQPKYNKQGKGTLFN